VRRCALDPASRSRVYCWRCAEFLLWRSSIQVRAINTTRTTVTVYEEPREARSDLTLKPGEEFWMILCRRPGIGPCSVTIRAVDDAKAVVFCRKYAQDELTRDPRVVVDTERRC